MGVGYVTLGANDLAKSAAFYDAVLGELGWSRGLSGERFIAWGSSPEAAGLGIIKPFDGKAATVGNGVMVALLAPSREAVERVWRKALALGGANEGDPGRRDGDVPGFYAAYFRDLEGNKLNVFLMES
jgi:predicted lactoylglutathione lyase